MDPGDGLLRAGEPGQQLTWMAERGASAQARSVACVPEAWLRLERAEGERGSILDGG